MTTSTIYDNLPPTHMTLGDMVIWWENQSFTYDKGGSFNVSLYLQICKIKRYEGEKSQPIHVRLGHTGS